MSGAGRSPLAARRTRPSTRRSPAPRTRSSRSSRRARSSAAAAPTLRFRSGPATSRGRRLFTIALTAVITIEPSKRRYDEPTRERLVELFGEPSGGRRRRRTSAGRRPTCSSRRSRARPSSSSSSRAPTTSSSPRPSTSTGSPTATAPLRFHFNGTVFYEADDGRMQIVQVPWDRSPRFGMPVEVWREAIDAAYPYRAWVRSHTDTLERLQRRKAERGLPTFDAVVDELLGRGGAERVSEPLEQLVSLAALRGLRALPLHARRDQERDPDAVRDRLPARVREAQPATFDHLRLECVLAAEPEAELSRDRALPAGRGRAPPGGRAPARARAGCARRARRDGVGPEFAFEGARALRGRAGCRCRARSRSPACGGCAPASTTPPRSTPGLERAEALVASLLSTHVVARGARRALRLAARARRRRRRRGRRPRGASTPSRCSPRRPTTRSSRATIVLPDHPRARAREPRQPVRQHRDRGGAAAARAGALGRRARGDRRAGPGGAAR